MQQEKTLSMQEEDEEFIREFKRVIDNKDVKDAEDIAVDEICQHDPCVDMELGLRRDGEETQHATAKRRKAMKQFVKF